MRARHSTKSPQRKASLKRVRALTAELATIATRQAEIVAELEGDEEALLAVRTNTPPLDREALALGLLWKHPNLPVTRLAAQVGVSRRTLYRWASVRQFLNARAGEKRMVRQDQAAITETDWDDIDARLDEE